MKYWSLLCSLPAILCVLRMSQIPASQAQETGGRLQVINHHVTQRSSSQQVRIERQDECSGPIQGSVKQCDGELNGTYTWAGENQAQNYIFFTLNGRANISRIRLTYAVVSSATQSPKVSFCAVLGDDQFNISVNNLNCREMNIQSTASYMIQTSSLDMPFDIDTEYVTMEIITQGIKADFTATGVEFIGSYLQTATTSDAQFTTTTTSDSVTGTNTNQEMGNTTTNGQTKSPQLYSNYIMYIVIMFFVTLSLHTIM